MIRAYLLYTGEDGHSHISAGSIAEEAFVKADHALFKETPANSVLNWHNAPISQYVITLSGILEFTTQTGETCTIYPGDVLVATDQTGTGHQWRLLNQEPWKRIYVVYQQDEDTGFIPDL